MIVVCYLRLMKEGVARVSPFSCARGYTGNGLERSRFPPCQRTTRTWCTGESRNVSRRMPHNDPRRISIRYHREEQYLKAGYSQVTCGEASHLSRKRTATGVAGGPRRNNDTSRLDSRALLLAVSLCARRDRRFTRDWLDFVVHLVCHARNVEVLTVIDGKPPVLRSRHVTRPRVRSHEV